MSRKFYDIWKQGKKTEIRQTYGINFKKNSKSEQIKTKKQINKQTMEMDKMFPLVDLHAVIRINRYL